MFIVFLNDDIFLTYLSILGYLTLSVILMELFSAMLPMTGVIFWILHSIHILLVTYFI